MKKNTLLYLNTELVGKAKKHNLNISHITEQAIKANLFPYLSYGEKAAIDFWDYLKKLEKNKQAFFLPVRIKRLKIKKVGRIKNLDVEFKEFNIVIGKNASGKTTLIRSIAHLFGHEMIKEYLSEDAKIELEIKPKRKYTLSNKDKTKCVLVDCGAAMFDKEYYLRFFDFMRKLDMQVIMTELKLRDDVDTRGMRITELEDVLVEF